MGAVRYMQTGENGAPGEIRTHDPQIRNLVLYPTELRARYLAYIMKYRRGNTLQNHIIGQCSHNREGFRGYLAHWNRKLFVSFAGLSKSSGGRLV